nr:MAG TPA: hypothetical protein [Caudoviricetes sp.]
MAAPLRLFCLFRAFWLQFLRNFIGILWKSARNSTRRHHRIPSHNPISPCHKIPLSLRQNLIQSVFKFYKGSL